MGELERKSVGIVLAGGKARRMGQDKALLMSEGRTFLAHVVAALRTLTDTIIVVTDFADKYDLPQVQFVLDAYPEVGPVGGIVTGLMAAGEGTHFVVPCDTPMLQRSLLELLQTAADTSCDAIVPKIAGEPEPLLAMYRHTALPKLIRYLESGRRSARGALAEIDVRYLEEASVRAADPKLYSFRNINTPEDFAALQPWKAS